MLPAGSLEVPLPGYRQATHSLMLLKMGGINAPKRVELSRIINKPLFLHLVCVYIIQVL
jgi:hypothetical protein